MDLEFLLSNYMMFVYEVHKFYDQDEFKIKSYRAKQHIVIISTKRVFIYYYDKFIDSVNASLKEMTVLAGEDELKLDIEFLNAKHKFSVEFNNQSDKDDFVMYFEKYSKK